MPVKGKPPDDVEAVPALWAAVRAEAHEEYEISYYRTPSQGVNENPVGVRIVTPEGLKFRSTGFHTRAENLANAKRKAYTHKVQTGISTGEQRSPKPPVAGSSLAQSAIQDFPAFGDAWSKHERRIEANEPNYLCFPCDDTGRMFDVECPWCPRCDSDSCLTPDGQRTPIRQQFGLHLCNPHTGNRWCNVACLRASGLDDCYDNHARSVLLATVWGEAWHRPFRPTEVASRIACYTPLLEELTQYAQAALASLRPTEGTP